MAYKGSYLAVNKILNPDDYLVSPNGEYVAYLEGNGRLSLCYAIAGTQNPDWGRCYWQSPVAVGSAPWGVMQQDGNFVLYYGPETSGPDTHAYFASNTNLDRTFVAAMLDDGNLVVCTGTPPGDPEEIVWSALPQISAGCKFMQNYRVTVPVNGGPEVLAIRNTAGTVELFTLSSGGDICTFWPDSASETGYSQAALTNGLKASHLAGATDSAGNVVLFASSGQQVYSLAETGDAANRWGTAQPITTAQMPVIDLVAANVAGDLYLAALQTVDKTSQQMAVFRWGVDLKINPVGPLFSALSPLFLRSAGSPAEPTVSVVIADKLFSWGITSGRITTATLDTSQAVLGLDVATDGTGTGWVVAALQNGQVCRMTPGSDPLQPLTWTPLWPDISYSNYSVQFQDVVAETDASGGVHVFAVSKPQAVVDGDPAKYNVLYHRLPGAPAGSQPVPISKSTGMQLAGVANDAGSIDLFAVSAGNLVTHLFAEEEGNWVEERVLDPADDTLPITEYSSYATDVTLYDGDQSVLSDESVEVYASDRTRIEINGLTFFIDEQRSAPVRTNGAGMLCISQETGSLASPLLRIQLSAERMSDQAPIIVVEPYADVQHALSDQSADTLLNAKVTNDDGTQSDLLQGSYREGTTPESLAYALENFMGSTQHQGELDATQSALLAARAQVHMPGHKPTVNHARRSTLERDRFWSRQAPHPGGLRYASALRAGRPCRLTFDQGGFGYERLTAEQAADLRNQRLATLPDVSASGIGNWFSKIGDALRAVAEGIASVAQVIYDGLTATLDLIIDGVTYAFNAVVQFVEDAFDMVEMIFNHVKVFFEQLYKWLAWLFDWTSIKQTSVFVANSFNEMMKFLKEAVDQLGPKVDNGFAAFKTQFAAMMDDAINNVAGKYTLGGYEQRNASYDPDADSATSNNFFLNEFVANTGDSGPSQALAAQIGSSEPIDTLTSLLEELTTVEEDSTDSFNQALDYFTNLGKEPDQIFRMAFAGMLSTLKGIGLVGLDLANKIVDALLKAMSDIIDTFSKVVNQTIFIPFVSTFYKWITGADLTLLNVVSMVTAIPSAIIYKITTGDPLFTASSGPGSAQDFTSVITCPNMLAATGLAPQLPRSAADPIQHVSKRMAYGMAGTYLTVTYIGGLLSAVGEMKIPAPWQGRLSWISYGGIGCGILSAVFSFPWFYADAGEETTVEGVLFMTLSLSIVIGVFIETMSTNFPPSAINDIRAIAFTVSGALMLGHAAATTKDNPDGRIPAWAILQRVPWAVKFLRLTTISTMTAEFSVLVLVAIDHLCGLSSGVLGFLVLRERYDPDAARLGIEASPA